MLRVLPDTNVLLGIRELDLLMRCHAAEILEVVWCDELLAEFERKLPQVWRFTPENAAAAVQRFTAAAPNGRIQPLGLPSVWLTLGVSGSQAASAAW